MEFLPTLQASFATKRREDFDDNYSGNDDQPLDVSESVASTPFSESECSYSSDFQTPEPDGFPHSRRYATPRAKRMALHR